MPSYQQKVIIRLIKLSLMYIVRQNCVNLILVDGGRGLGDCALGGLKQIYLICKGGARTDEGQISCWSVWVSDNPVQELLLCRKDCFHARESAFSQIAFQYLLFGNQEQLFQKVIKIKGPFDGFLPFLLKNWRYFCVVFM